MIERVTGIGRLFFKADHPEEMAAWYQQDLGLRIKDGHTDFVWRENERSGRTRTHCLVLVPG